MKELNLFRIYTDILNQNNFKYFISGSVASIVYGDPRLTNDIDLVIFLNKNDIDKFIRAFPSESFYCPHSEVIKSELEQKEGGHFNLIHHESGFKADIYPAGTDELQIWAMRNARQIEFEGSTIFIAPPEYVIIKKLEFYKEGKSQKHLTDIKGILNSSSELIDFGFLDNIIKEKSLNDSWDEVKKRNG
jgi:hypothetical protein